MEPGYRLRLYLLTAVVLVCFGALLNRLYEFQIERRAEFLNMVPGNRTVTVREPGTRGEITDRNGIVLARNLRKYEVTFNLDEIREAYLAQHVTDPTIERVSDERGLPRKHSEKDIVAIVNEWTIARLRKLDLARNYNATALRTHYLTHGGLIPFSYRADLTYDEFARFAEHNLELPGVYLTMRPQRQYPFRSLASHVIGYLKQWEKGDIPEADARRFNHYIGDEKGIAGVEASMDGILRGPEGRKTIVKNEKGRTIRMSDYTKPGTGAKVQLAIDARIQYLLENTLRHAGRAAGVIMNVNTGEVLAMASVPDYEPNAFIPSIAPKRWRDYNSNKQLSPLTNRAISPYAPGSTMKVPTAISGALQDMAGRSFSCEGFVMYGNHPVGCWIWNKSRGRHGSLTLPKAIQQSCNPYFNKLANTIGWRAMVDGCQMVGIGSRTGVELPNEKPGILPGSRAWRASNPGAVMTPALTAFLSIGQGDTLATPLQMCAMTACVANGGRYYQPRVVRKAVSEEGKTLVPDKPKLVVDLIEAGIKPEDLELIRKGMSMAVNVPGGTAGRVRMEKIEVAAKTGTAQTVDNGEKSNNSWVISFAPYEKPEYAVCVLVQNGGSGGAVCGPLVKLIYQGLFSREEGVRLPLKPQREFAGHTDRIEEIVIADETPAAAGGLQPGSTGESGDEEPVLGETGDEVGELAVTADAAADDSVTPVPTLTPEIDVEGTVIPRAVPVPEP
ncbi:MAG: penicillin-binding transpeptidase domain-containing protein [Akkermansiaceae bacterium]|jgi:penicillin-binding protein 2|nr:penicillin-binding transpeptidase domain-containing protein [Akkermansiaceae bacterium]